MHMAAYPVNFVSLLASSASAPAASSSSSSISSSSRTGAAAAIAPPRRHQQYGAHELEGAIQSLLLSSPSSSSSSLSSSCSPFPGQSIRSAATLFGVPTSTLHRHLSAARSNTSIARNGRPPLLSRADEETIVEWIRYASRINLSPLRLDIRIAAAKIAMVRGGRQFGTKDGLPGAKWFRGFEKRHTDIVSHRHHRLPPGLPSRSQLEAWTMGLQQLVMEHRVTADRIFNVDETGIDGRYGKKARVVHVRGEEPCVVGPTWRGHFTCVVCICANGEYLPPMYIAQGSGPISSQHAAAMTAGCIAGTGVVQTTSGWIDNSTWSQWLQFFVSHLSAREKPAPERKVILILDSHESRFAWQSIEYAMSQNVIIYALLPNSTSICQPLDVGFFGPFKVHVVLRTCGAQ